MNQEKDIQELFSKLQNQSSSVRPELWQNIQHGAGLTGAGTAATGSVSLLGKFFIAAAVVATLGTYLYLLTKDADNQELNANNNPKKETPKAVVNPAIEEVTDQTSEDVEETKIIENASVNSETPFETPSEANTTDLSGEPTVTNDDKTEITPTEDGADGETPVYEENVVPAVQEEIKLSILSHQEEEDELDWLFTVEGPDAGSYYWTFTDGYSVSGTRVRHRFMSDGTYGVCVNVIGIGYQTGKECIDVDAMRKITVAMPNVFTPGSSPGVNDLYDIDHAKSENIVQYRLVIYDSKGVLVFQSSEAQKAWNGNNRFGEPMPTGTYVCVVEAEGYAGQKSVSRHNLTLKR